MYLAKTDPLGQSPQNTFFYYYKTLNAQIIYKKVESQ